MLVWETDPSLRDGEPAAAFADVWCASAIGARDQFSQLDE
jgi:hypothetical protein